MPDLATIMQAWASLNLVVLVAWMAVVEIRRLRKAGGR